MNQSHEPAGQKAAPASDPASTISTDIDRTLEHRSAPPDTWRRQAEDLIKRDTSKAWNAMKHRPSLGMLVFGGLAIAAADAIGVGELALGLAVGYGVYRVLRKGKHAEEEQGPREGQPVEQH